MEKINGKLIVGTATIATGIILIVIGALSFALRAFVGFISIMGAVSDGPGPKPLGSLGDGLLKTPEYIFYLVVIVGIGLLVLGIKNRDRAKAASV